MPTTSNFGWTTPADTDLVKDGALAIRTLGNGIDTSLLDLKGGTTGQILSKASNTDLDYTWINNDVGDITNVGVTAPITGGGSSGSVTIGIDDGTTTQKGAVQLEDSTSSTSTTKAATPNSVKSAYDLANAAIPKSLVDAAGDLIYATANDTPARLALGTAGQVLTVNSGATAPEWATASGSSGPTFKATRTGSDQSFTASTVTKIQYATEVWDTDSCYDPTTNYRFTPNKAGYYSVTVSAYVQQGDLQDAGIYIRKNGSNEAVLYQGDVDANWTFQVNALVSMNGSSDYLEGFIYADGASPVVLGNAIYSYFTAVWIRGL